MVVMVIVLMEIAIIVVVDVDVDVEVALAPNPTPEGIARWQERPQRPEESAPGGVYVVVSFVV